MTKKASINFMSQPRHVNSSYINKCTRMIFIVGGSVYIPIQIVCSAKGQCRLSSDVVSVSAMKKTY